MMFKMWKIKKYGTTNEDCECKRNNVPNVSNSVVCYFPVKQGFKYAKCFEECCPVVDKES